MNPLRSPGRSTSGWLRTVLVAAVLGTASCEAIPTAPPAEGPAASVSAATSQLRLVVRRAGRRPVPLATVRVYDASGPVATLLTDRNGVAEADLPHGGYCVSARVAPPEWLSLLVVAPGTSFPSLTPVRNDLAPVVRAQGADLGPRYVALTPAAFEACLENLYVQHGPGGTSETIVLPQAHVLRPQAIGLNGETLSGITFYAVTPVDVPWRPSTIHPDILTGFLNFIDVTASPASLPVSPNAPWALEILQSAYSGFNIAASEFGQSGAGDAVSPVDVQVAPLMCDQQWSNFPAGNKGVDIIWAGWGYSAFRPVPASLTTPLSLDLTRASIQLKHTGAGRTTVTFRTDRGEAGRLTSKLVYNCTAGGCQTESISHHTAGNPQTLEAFYQVLDASAGLVKVTVMLQGIPAHRQLRVDARSQHDQVPLSSRESETSSNSLLRKPDRCSVPNSNDASWWIGPI